MGHPKAKQGDGMNLWGTVMEKIKIICKNCGHEKIVVECCEKCNSEKVYRVSMGDDSIEVHEDDLDKFIGCAKGLTGGLSPRKYIDKKQGG